jgi:hypothetical protein
MTGGGGGITGGGNTLSFRPEEPKQKDDARPSSAQDISRRFDPGVVTIAPEGFRFGDTLDAGAGGGRERGAVAAVALLPVVLLRPDTAIFVG